MTLPAASLLTRPLATAAAAGWWLPTLVTVALVAVVVWLTWLGWRGRRAKHALPPLEQVPAGVAPGPALTCSAAYVGTTTSGDARARVEAQGLRGRGLCALRLTDAGLDVLRPGAGFRIPASEIRGARHDEGIAGKDSSPQGVLVVTWRHGDVELDSGFRLDVRDVAAAHDEWIARLGGDGPHRTMQAEKEARGE